MAYLHFTDETGATYGSFEVYWIDCPDELTGWYWQACYAGCLPDAEPNGPFESYAMALEDALRI